MKPALRALAFASRWFDAPVVHRVFEPLVADWQREWQDASPSRRTWVSVRGLAAFSCAVILSGPRVFLTPSPASVLKRVTTRVALFCFIAASLLSIPFLDYSPGWPWLPLLLPAGLTLAMPFAMLIAVDGIRCHEDLPDHVERAAAVKLAIVATLFMVVCGGFVVPAANQAWRAAMPANRGSAPALGVRELTTVELITNPGRANLTGHPRPAAIRRELNNRASLAALPVLLIWLRWRALDLPRRGRFSPLPASMVTALVIFGFSMLYWAAPFVEGLLRLRAGTGLWLPLAAFAAWGLAEQRWRRRSVPKEA